MSDVKIFWDPKGFELDSIGKKKYLRTTDGDSPYVSMPIRMLSIDTPEVHYPGNQKPSKHDEKLAQLADWIREGHAPVDDGLSHHLYAKLASGKAGTLQEVQGERATEMFKKLLAEKLTKPSGAKRNVFLQAADEHFDSYGRLLAYMSPAYSGKELAGMTRKKRATFNLLMVDSGWAATFPLFPSIPGYDDLLLLHDCAKKAVDNKKGAWTDPLMLTGYEFRMCVRLYEVTRKLVAGQKMSSYVRNGWITRFCADMTTLEILSPQNFFKALPFNRIFIWPEDVTDAVGKMNLVPGE